MGKVLVAGGAGFLGSHLCKAFLEKGYEVTCADNLCTGRHENIAGLEGNDNFVFVECDITVPLPDTITNHTYSIIANLASPASPPVYTRLALETLLVGAVGTRQLLELAKRDECRFIQASTSEVYGEPQVHPQSESYWGNVNSYGARSMYDESKRYAEALIWVYRHQHQVNTGIARIFNTYGPHMDPKDGRVVSNFITQALRGEPITMYGKGDQTRSFCYVSDQIDGLVRLAESDAEGPINIGNPTETTLLELAERVITLTDSTSDIVYKELPQDDPSRRNPDISLAKKVLGWGPKVTLEDGLERTIAYYRQQLAL
ncbi:MAG TPA: UDP-glucuronic acid decarboxylase family protein [Candidatus Saccharimonadales bacterium]|nr:UDP-glucuronic acid decarboxylase family protein [Candidatus Saccharimonadales bacterium]